MKTPDDGGLLPLSSQSRSSRSPEADLARHDRHFGPKQYWNRLNSRWIRVAAMIIMLVLLRLAESKYGLGIGPGLVATFARVTARSHPSQAASGPVVRVDYGAFRGRSNGQINSFYNIPYALPRE